MSDTSANLKFNLFCKMVNTLADLVLRVRNRWIPEFKASLVYYTGCVLS